MSQMHKPQGNKAGVVPQGLTDALAKINVATTKVAAKITELRDQVKTRMTDQEVADLQNQLDALSTQLEAVAADPQDPVPEPTPEPQPEPTPTPEPTPEPPQQRHKK